MIDASFSLVTHVIFDDERGNWRPIRVLRQRLHYIWPLNLGLLERTVFRITLHAILAKKSCPSSGMFGVIEYGAKVENVR